MNYYYKTIKLTTGSALLALSVQLPLMAEPKSITDHYIYQEVVAHLPANKAKTGAVAQAHIQYELQSAHTNACKSACKLNWAQQGELITKEGPYLGSVNIDNESKSVWIYKTTRRLDTTSCVSGPVYDNTIQTSIPEWLSIHTHRTKAEKEIATIDE